MGTMCSQCSEVCLSSKNYRFPAGWFQTSLYNASNATLPITLDGFYPFNIYRTWNILENLKIASQLDFSFHISMIVLSLPNLFCFISSFALVVPFKLKIKDIWLQKSNNNKYLLNVDSTPSQIDTWYILSKQNIVSSDILTLNKKENPLISDDKNSEVFTDIDSSTLVIISYNEKNNKYGIKGVLNDTRIISPLETTWISSSQQIWSSPTNCDNCLPCMLHSIDTMDHVKSKTVGISDFSDRQLEDNQDNSVDNSIAQHQLRRNVKLNLAGIMTDKLKKLISDI